MLDTGIFDQERYFDVFIEYAKAGPEDICIRIEAINRGPEAAELDLIPHLWFRNWWAWTDPPGPEPSIRLVTEPNYVALAADDSHASGLPNLQFPYSIGTPRLYAPQGGTALFTDNENNAVRLYGSSHNRKPYVKDAFHRYIVNHEACVNPEHMGTKSCIRYHQVVPPGGSMILRLRLASEEVEAPLIDVDRIIGQRKAEADEFYTSIYPPSGYRRRAIHPKAGLGRNAVGKANLSLGREPMVGGR